MIPAVGVIVEMDGIGVAPREVGNDCEDSDRHEADEQKDGQAAALIKESGEVVIEKRDNYEEGQLEWEGEERERWMTQD